MFLCKCLDPFFMADLKLPHDAGPDGLTIRNVRNVRNESLFRHGLANKVKPHHAQPTPSLTTGVVTHNNERGTMKLASATLFPSLHLLNPQPVLKLPVECTETELTVFETAMIENGETASPALKDRIRRTDRLAFPAYAGGRFFGIGALKSAKPEHGDGVFMQATAHMPPERFSISLGWLAGDAESTARIAGAQVAHAQERPVFAITHANDTAIHTMLPEHGFRPDGASYAIARGSYSNQLYLSGVECCDETCPISRTNDKTATRCGPKLSSNERRSAPRVRWWMALLIAALSQCGKEGDKQSDIEVEARLLRTSRMPKAAEIAPYREALSVFEYAVENHVRGSDPGSPIRVAHWAVADGREQTPPATVGNVRLMRLAPMSDVRGMEEVRRQDDLPFDLGREIYFDLTQSLSMASVPGPLQFDYRGDLSDRMRLYWHIRSQLRLVVLGNSLTEVGVDPSQFYLPENTTVPVALNLAVAGSNLDFQDLIARQYVADLPRLEWVLWGVTPRIFNRNRQVDRRAEIFRASPGYVHDLARPMGDRSPSIAPPLDMKAIYAAVGKRSSVWGWACHLPRSMPETLTVDVENEIRRHYGRPDFKWEESAWKKFEESVLLLTQRGARVLLFTPPFHPLSAQCESADVDGTSHRDYQMVMEHLTRLAETHPQVIFEDINNAGRHGFPHEMFFDREHLHASGAGPLTALLSDIMKRAGADAERKNSASPVKQEPK